MSLIDLTKRRGRRLAELLGRPVEFAEPVEDLEPLEEPEAEAPEPEAVAPEPEPEPEPEALAPPPAPEPVVALTPALPAAVVEDATLRALTLEMIERRADVLAVGLGPWEHPDWAHALMAQARAVTIVDPDKSRLQPLRSYGMQTVVTSFDHAGWLTRVGGQRFHVAVVSAALTHLPDPTAFLRQVRELLHPGGVVVAIVPNVAYGENRLALLKGEYPREFASGAPVHHYTRARLRELFAFAGYTLVGLSAHEKALFTPGSDLVPELFPDALLAAIGQEDDMRTAHFVAKATPASAESLLQELFDEQEQLRKAVRNELARVSRTHEALTFRLKEADDQIENLAVQLTDARRSVGTLEDQAMRAEHNIRRLAKEADDATRELEAVKGSLGWRLLQLFRSWRKPKAEAVAPANNAEPSTWKYDG